jgi:hypothetical protein
MSKYGSIMAILITAMMLTVLLPLSFEGAGANYGKKTVLNKADASFAGSTANEQFGLTNFASSKGDVNGDGYGDLLIGTASGAGKVYLILGKSVGWTKNANPNTADVTFIGENASDIAGFSFAIAGDMNGDGLDDIVIGAFNAKHGLVTPGAVYIIFGRAAGWPQTMNLSLADASFLGEYDKDGAGDTVTAAGDVNGDGLADILAGSQMYDGLGKNSDSGKVYLILGKSSGWTKYKNLSQADGTFIGEHWYDDLSTWSTGGGDLNGDGLDDVVMAAAEFNNEKGKTYVFFGKTTGWAKNVNVSQADASFIGVTDSNEAGYGNSAAGDINGDGLHDLVISAPWEDQGGNNAGKVFIVFGKMAGWAKNVSLASADASINYTAADGNFGWGLSVGGDVNGDGIDDMLIGAPLASDGGNAQCGMTFLFLGKKTGWAMDTPSRNADAIFVGEASGDGSGRGPVITEDLNGDGFDDLGIPAFLYDQGANVDAGKFYILFFDTNKPPTAVTSIKAYASADYTNETALAMQGDKIYVELQGTDGNASRKDVAVVRLMSDSALVGYDIYLYETAIHSGIYRGSYKIASRTSEERNWIKGVFGDDVMAHSFTDPTKWVTVAVGGHIELMPKADDHTAVEDQLYNVHYYVTNATTPSGMFETNATWLEMNGTTGNLSGTPDNSNVGSYRVRLNVTDGFGRSDEHNFTVVVANTPPDITTTDNTSVDEDEYYAVDYNSSDDGQGTITWHLATDASWLKVNATTGLLNGTPVNSNVGSWYVNVSVDDGNGGKDFHNFTLEVVNFNDRPNITTTDVKTATEDVKYQVDYKVVDVDVGDTFTWFLKTNAKWLKINAATGRLNGTPTNDEVGSYYVNVTVKDQDGLSDYHNFTLTVLNANDPPVWKDLPPAEVKINSLQAFTFDVNATDIDKGDKLTYGVIVTPSTTVMSMNKTTGLFSIGPVSKGIYMVNLSCTDTIARINYVFKLNVSHKNSPPTALLTGPVAGATVTTAKPVLTWSTADKDADLVTVDVYFSDTEPVVTARAASAKVLSASNAKTYAFTTYLVPGKKYYWTAVPFDGNDTGTCLNGTFSFTVAATAHVNHPPTITLPAKVPSATTGKDYKLTMVGSDQDAGTTLTYWLTGAPAGMSISNTGQITWKPTKSQTGTFTFSVVVNDGEYSANTPVTVKVNKASEANLGSMMLPILLILILLILAIVLLAMSMRKTPVDEGEEEEGEEEGEEKVGGEEE